MDIKAKRLLAIYIDLAVIGYISRVLIYILTLGNCDSKSPLIFQIISAILSLVIAVLLIIRKDLLFKNASIGKKVVGIKIVDAENNDILDKKILIKRNKETLFDLPLYPIHILTSNESTSDEKLKTKVVNK